MNIKARERGIHWHSYEKKKKKTSFADDYSQDLILLILRITAWSSLYCVPNIRYHHSSQGPKDIGLFSLLLSVRRREEVWFLSRLDLRQTSRTDRQTDTVLSCFASLYFTDVTCFTNWRQNPSPVKKLQLAWLQHLLYSGQSETEPTVSSRDVCVFNGGMLDFQVHALAFMPSIQNKMFIFLLLFLAPVLNSQFNWKVTEHIFWSWLWEGVQK